jgi:hypothetical protein
LPLALFQYANHRLARGGDRLGQCAAQPQHFPADSMRPVPQLVDRSVRHARSVSTN